MEKGGKQNAHFLDIFNQKTFVFEEELLQVDPRQCWALKRGRADK